MKQMLLVVSVLMIWLGRGEALAQQLPGPPKPGPEHKRLEYFVGKWTFEGEMQAGPMGPGGKVSSVETCEWLAGGFFLICRSEFKGPMGESRSLGVMGYDGSQKIYTYNAFDSMGNVESGKGTVQGSTWSWTGESKMAGKASRSRGKVTEVSPASYEFKFEYSADGSTWTPLIEGKTNKAK